MVEQRSVGSDRHTLLLRRREDGREMNEDREIGRDGERGRERERERERGGGGSKEDAKRYVSANKVGKIIY